MRGRGFRIGMRPHVYVMHGDKWESEPQPKPDAAVQRVDRERQRSAPVLRRNEHRRWRRQHRRRQDRTAGPPVTKTGSHRGRGREQWGEGCRIERRCADWRRFERRWFGGRRQRRASGPGSSPSGCSCSLFGASNGKPGSILCRVGCRGAGPGSDEDASAGHRHRRRRAGYARSSSTRSAMARAARRRVTPITRLRPPGLTDETRESGSRRRRAPARRDALRPSSR